MALSADFDVFHQPEPIARISHSLIPFLPPGGAVPGE